MLGASGRMAHDAREGPPEDHAGDAGEAPSSWQRAGARRGLVATLALWGSVLSALAVLWNVAAVPAEDARADGDPEPKAAGHEEKQLQARLRQHRAPAPSSTRAPTPPPTLAPAPGPTLAPAPGRAPSTAAPPAPSPSTASTVSATAPPRPSTTLSRPSRATVEAAAFEASLMCADGGCDRPFVGVNLGGWLVLEEAMMPGEGAAEDEAGFIRRLGGPSDPRAAAALHRHWGGFVTEEDLDALRAFGVTHCRIPIGYWLLEEDPASEGFLSGGERYLFRALAWMKRRGMRAVLDLHALPGGQAANRSSTGRRAAQAGFFRDQRRFSQGKDSMRKLAHLVVDFDNNVLTSGVVVGVELVNEPDWSYWSTSPGIQDLFTEMIPEIRQILRAQQTAILLSFAGPTMRSEGVEWLSSKRLAHPKEFAGVFYDAHISHAHGDDDAAGREWSPEKDSCKTCCRDPHLLAPLVHAGLPIVVGEYSVNSGTPHRGDPDFWRAYLQNQLSLWASTPGVRGSFFWNHRAVLGDHAMRVRKLLGERASPPVSLLEIINSGRKSWRPTVDQGLCPTEDMSRCPRIEPGNVLWIDDCAWSSA